MAPIARKAAPAAAPVLGFLDLSFYSGGFLLPPGRYAMEHNIVLHSWSDKDGNKKGDPKLGCMLTAYPLNGGDPIEQFLSMGTKAHLSFMPSENGKGVVAVPGGPGMVSNKANWFYYLESLKNCGAAEVGGNDISVLDGIWVVTDNILEPEDRKNFASTGEVEQEQKGPRKMPIVVEIIDGGKPWEGGGGFPEAGKALASASSPAAPAAAARPAARPPARATVAAPAAAAGGDIDADTLLNAATNAIASVLSKGQNAKGVVKLILKTGTFKAASEAESPEVAQAVIDTYFGADETALKNLLGELSFTINGPRIDPA